MEEQKMTPQTALEILEKATGALQASRQDHNAIIVSLQTLAALVQEVQAAPTKPSEDKK
jgi:hypothetical protein